MPAVINHKGPSFREYKRTPAENKLIELESKLANMEKLLSQLAGEGGTSLEEIDPTNENPNNENSE